MSPGKKTVKEDEKRLQNELRQVFIDKYRTGHFDSIQSLKKVIKECQKLLKEAEKPIENVATTDKTSWYPVFIFGSCYAARVNTVCNPVRR